jgi:flagellar biosynthesis/type III secretory pathway protein FliH
MLMTEFNLDDAKAVWQEEAMEKGIELGESRGKAEGKAEGKEEGLEIGETKVLSLMEQGYSLDEIKAKLKPQ